MMERYVRCINCGVEYLWQSSGPRSPEFNDKEYCPGCKQKVVEALSSVPKKYECRHRDIKEIPQLSHLSLEEVMSWYDPNQMIRRIWPGLYNLETGDRQTIEEILGKQEYSRWRFKVATWRDSREYSIEVPWEYDVVSKQFTNRWW